MKKNKLFTFLVSISLLSACSANFSTYGIKKEKVNIEEHYSFSKEKQKTNPNIFNQTLNSEATFVSYSLCTKESCQKDHVLIKDKETITKENIIINLNDTILTLKVDGNFRKNEFYNSEVLFVNDKEGFFKLDSKIYYYHVLQN